MAMTTDNDNNEEIMLDPAQGCLMMIMGMFSIGFGLLILLFLFGGCAVIF